MLLRRDAHMPYQEWKPYPPGSAVRVFNAYDEYREGNVEDFWWGYEIEAGEVSEGTIVKVELIEIGTTNGNS